jgi:hypothetical protein
MLAGLLGALQLPQRFEGGDQSVHAVALDLLRVLIA